MDPELVRIIYRLDAAVFGVAPGTREPGGELLDPYNLALTDRLRHIEQLLEKLSGGLTATGSLTIKPTT